MQEKPKLKTVKTFTVSEIAAMEKSAHATIKSKIESGEIPAFRVGNRYQIPEISLNMIPIIEAYREVIERCIVLTIGNFKGGCGKTSNILNIAATLSFLGYKVLIVDGDAQGNTTSGLGVNYGNFELKDNNFTKLLFLVGTNVSDNELKERITKSIVPIERNEINPKGCLHLIPNDPIMFDEVKYLDNTDPVDTILSFVKDDYDFILIDTPPSTDTIVSAEIMACDYFMITFLPEPFSTFGLPNILKPVHSINRVYRNRKGKDIEVLGGIITGESTSNVNKACITATDEELRKLTNNTSTLFNTKLTKTPTLAESQFGKGAMIFTKPQHNLTGEYLELTKEILERIIEKEYMRNIIQGDN